MSRWVRIRESFWFLPAVFCALAVVLAETLILVDRRLGGFGRGPLDVLVNRVGEAGSRDLLGAIAGSALTVAATTFSITIAVLATASATYGPRLVRNFMADRGNQFVLAVYTATFLYSLLVLRSIREPGGADDVFVPHLAVNVAVLLGVLSIGVLVYFINHISDSIQVGTLSRRVRDELVGSVDRLYPEEIGHWPAERADASDTPDVPDGLETDGVPVRSRDTGYLQAVAEDRLLAVLEGHDLVVTLRVRPGSHVIERDTLAVLWPPDRVDDDVEGKVRSCLPTGRDRSPHHDVEFAVLVLEEMAVRALSPSTNDPYTALNALDDLAAGLVRLAGRSSPPPYRYGEDGRLRVIAPRVVLTDLLDSVFDAMRLYAIEHPIVLRRTLRLAAQVGAASRAADVHARLVIHIDRLADAFERSSPQECDLIRLRRQAAEVGRALPTVPR